MRWTDEQLRAIQERKTNILLSAAAGSGKTTVLVGRILALIEAGEGSVERMLIVTFTRAASADMRAKLARELGKRAAEGDERCRAQQLLLERASITTLHGFCSEFLRTHFEQAGVDPAFRVLDDAENRRLKDEALDEAIEEAYAASGESLLALDYGRGPKGVRAMADALLAFLEERPDPETWLEAVCGGSEALRARWIAEMTTSARSCIDQALLFSRLALQDPGCNDNYAGPLEKDIQALEAMRTLEDYDSLYRALREFKQTTAGKAKCGPAGEEMKKLRASAKTTLEKAAMLDLPLPTALHDADALLPQMAELGRIALRARELLAERKAECSGLSYSDLEHRALRALNDAGVAQALRERYEHIFVDEYQDTSDVQEALVNRIARGDNLFMVGDVKQSIYRFRQAEPGLFLGKYADYARGEGGVLLPLTMNFRSQAKILDFVNLVFERAMHGGPSEIVYDELARLNCGLGGDGGEVEIHLLERGGEDSDETAQELKTCEQEAMFIAGRIRRLMSEHPGLHYRDFAILTRAKRGVLGRMATILLQMGIPAYADGTEGFYESMEITLALSLLKLVANRRSDVELIGVLRSPIVGLDNDALARIRIARPEVPFVDAALEYAQAGDDTGLRLKAFFEMLDRWQLLCLSADLGVLTRTILEESGFYDCAGALPGGRQRQANLNRLIANATAFDQSISGSLTRFLKHTEKLQARGEGDDAHLLGENDDVVRLMTAHKSKGLEFPVVFGAMMGRSYGSARRSELLYTHRDLGLGCAYCDCTLQSRRKTLPQLAIAERKRREDQAEELRILYVLMTRARERLELVGSCRSVERAQARWRALESVPDAAGSYLDVIMPAIKDGVCGVYLHRDPNAYLESGPAEGAQDHLRVLAELAPADADDEMVRALLWKYPDAQAATQPLKLSVTGLLRQLEGPREGEKLVERPAFLSESTGKLSGAERGTAYHRAMQCLELDALRNLEGRALENEIIGQLNALEAAARITPLQRTALRPRMLAGFFASEVGRRLLAAQEVRREWAFNVMMRISEALTSEESAGYADGEILMQGTIDCCFMEGGRWVLLDFKTDRSDDAEALTLRYRDQLRLYALALERITGIEVGEIRLCLLQGGESILIPAKE